MGKESAAVLVQQSMEQLQACHSLAPLQSRRGTRRQTDSEPHKPILHAPQQCAASCSGQIFNTESMAEKVQGPASLAEGTSFPWQKCVQAGPFSSLPHPPATHAHRHCLT